VLDACARRGVRTTGVTVLEVIINGEPLDWLWLQATGEEADGSRLDRNPPD